jgi:hypothetical protein
VSTINIFRSIADTYETLYIEEEKSIKEAVEADFTNAIISVNGFQQNENYVLKEGDLCTIRLFPEGNGADWGLGAGLGGFFGLMAVSLIGAITGPVGWAIGLAIIGGAAAAGSIVAGSLSAAGISLIGWLGSLGQQSSDLNSPDALEKIPQLRGAKNQSNYNKPIPIVMGKHLYTPMYIGSTRQFRPPPEKL